nr:hypothetical protein CFP56_72561 [Quercus suber]
MQLPARAYRHKSLIYVAWIAAFVASNRSEKRNVLAVNCEIVSAPHVTKTLYEAFAGSSFDTRESSSLLLEEHVTCRVPSSKRGKISVAGRIRQQRLRYFYFPGVLHPHLLSLTAGTTTHRSPLMRRCNDDKLQT